MRRLLAMSMGVLLGCAVAQAEACATPGDKRVSGIKTIRLWPGEAPQAKGTACEDTPTLTIFDPQPGHENGSAVVVLPGGAYTIWRQIWKAARSRTGFLRGFRAFVVSYRLGSNGYLLPVPLLDARRAVQMVRARANDYHVNPDRIVMIGFSAGGRLAALRRRNRCRATRTLSIRLSGYRAGPIFWCWAIRGSGRSRRQVAPELL